jgi:endonuclease YncB( thermonuclease family)
MTGDRFSCLMELREGAKMSRIKKISLGILVLLGVCCICTGGISVADRLGLMPEPSPELLPTDTPVILNTESPTGTPVIATVVIDDNEWIIEAPTPTVIPTVTPTATPTWITVLLPIIPNQPTLTPTPIAQIACIPQDTLSQIGVVITIIDGDTIEVQIDGANYKVRYIGIDSPEADAPFGERARIRNGELVSGKSVLLVKDMSEIDRFDRLLRYVIVDGSFINQILVREGFAVAKDYPPDTACSVELNEAQKFAEAALIGVWAPQPTPQVPSNSGGVAGGEPVCQCTGNLYNCKDFSRQSQAQACYNYCKSLGLGDMHRLDGTDNDGRVCESLP